MTNFEWLYENNKEGLISMICAKGTNECNCMFNDECGYDGYSYCSKEWLNSEHNEK